MSDVVSLSQTATSLGIVLGLVSLVGALLAHYKVVRPWWRKLKGDVTSGRDVLVGRPPIIDPVSKKQIAEALPSLGERLEVHQTKINGSLQDIVTLLESQQAQDHRINDHEARLHALETAAVERIVTKAESVSAWRAVEAVANGNGDDPEELD